MSRSLFVYSAPAGSVHSGDYRVTVDGEALSVYQTSVHFEMDRQDRVVAYAYFDADFAAGAVDVCVSCPEPVEQVVVRPLSLGIAAKIVQPRQVQFRIDRTCKISIDINGRTHGNLILFAGLPDANAPAADDPDVLYFGPGLHTITDDPYGIIRVRSGQTVYLAGGAVLRARILGQGVRDVTIRGRGILDGSTLLGRHSMNARKALGIEPINLLRPQFIDFHDSRGIRIEGIHVIDTPHWTIRFHECREIVCRDLRLIGFVQNSDGIDLVNSSDVLIDDTFIRTADDCIVLKGAPLSAAGAACAYTSEAAPSLGHDPLTPRSSMRNIRVQRCVLWADLASVLEIGHETQAAEICDVEFRDIDILRQDFSDIGYHAINMCVSDYAWVHDIRYEDIRVEQCRRLAGLKVEEGSYAWPSRGDGRGRIERITFKGIHSLDNVDVSLYGISEANAVCDLTFEDLTLGGRQVRPVLHANGFVRDLHFVEAGRTETLDRVYPSFLNFAGLELGPAADHPVEVPIHPGAKAAIGPLPGGCHIFKGVPFSFPHGAQHAIVLRGPEAGAGITIGGKCPYLFFLQGCIAPETPFNTVLWRYVVEYEDGAVAAIPVGFNTDVSDWDMWSVGGWFARVKLHKFYVQMWKNHRPGAAVRKLRVVMQSANAAAILLALTMATPASGHGAT